MKRFFVLFAAMITLVTPYAMAGEPPVSRQTAQAPIQVIEVDGIQIAHRVIGEGEPLLLINRFRADMNHWDPVFIDRLAQHRQVILFDYPGMGLSSGTPRNSVVDMADDLVRFMDMMDLAQADVIGWSLGTTVGLMAATRNPERFERLALIGAIYAGGMEQARVTPDIQGFLDRAVKPQPSNEDFLYILFGDTANSKRLGVEAFQRRALWQEPEGGIALVAPDKWMRHAEAINGYQSDPNMADSLRISSPVLFINGDRDHIAPPRIAAEWIQIIENSQMSVIRSSGHNVHGQDPALVSQMVLDFLN